MATIIDWNEFALNAAVRRLVIVLRSSYDVRVGFLTPAGELVDLCRGEQFGQGGIFDHYVDALGFWEGDGQRVSFRMDLKGWAEAIGMASGKGVGGTLRLASAVGFEAFVVPVFHEEEGTLLGSVFCAGFVSTEAAMDGMDTLRRFLPRELQNRLASEENLRVAQLGREQRRFVEMLTRALADELGPHLHSVDDRRRVERSDAVEYQGMIGASQPMRKLFGLIARVARTNSTVLIEGENGTGKELVARAIHDASLRRDQEFLGVNCAALPGELIASELFGHVKGAFSGAHRERVGLFEAADGGTLLLDEIGDMDVGLQVKLLRILQEGTFNRVGDHQPRKVNVRVLCATNRDLQELVRQGKFREDLYYRIKVIQLAIPALRERGTDVSLLLDFFLARTGRLQGKGAKKLSPQCREIMMRYPWPGNVRELENEIERIVILSGDDVEITEGALSPRLRRENDTPDPFAGLTGYSLPDAIEHLERTMILAGLRRTGWNKTQTARELGVSRRNLIRKVAHYELEEDGQTAR